MKIIAIDTTAYSTALSLFDSERGVCFNYVKAHKVYLEEEEASFILPVYHRKTLREFMAQAKKEYPTLFDNLDYCAVSAVSGLKKCLDSGISYFEKQLQPRYSNIKLIKIDHHAAHVFSSWINQEKQLIFPLLTFTASSGHNALVYLRSKVDCEILTEGALKIELSGNNTYCALGKVYYLAVRMILAENNPSIAVNDFSVFDSLVDQGTAVYLNEFVEGVCLDFLDFNFYPLLAIMDNILKKNSQSDLANVAKSFYQAYGLLFVSQITKVLLSYPAKQIHICGGISHNNFIMELLGEKTKIPLLAPQNGFGFDNAAMIAYTAYLKISKNVGFEMKPEITDPKISELIFRKIRSKIYKWKFQ